MPKESKNEEILGKEDGQSRWKLRISEDPKGFYKPVGMIL